MYYCANNVRPSAIGIGSGRVRTTQGKWIPTSSPVLRLSINLDRQHLASGQQDRLSQQGSVTSTSVRCAIGSNALLSATTLDAHAECFSNTQSLHPFPVLSGSHFPHPGVANSEYSALLFDVVTWAGLPLRCKASNVQ